MRANGGCATSKSFVEVVPTSKTGEQSAIRENIRGHGDEFTLGEIMLWCSNVFFKSDGGINQQNSPVRLNGHKLRSKRARKHV